MNDQRTYVTDIGHMAVQLQGVDKGLARVDTAGQLKGQHRSSSLGRQFLSPFVPWRTRQPRVVDAHDIPVPVEVLRDAQGIGHMALDPKAQRLQTLRDQERIERGGR